MSSATSGVKSYVAATTGAQVATGPGVLSGVNFTPLATGNVLTLYDNAAADNSGTVIFKALATTVDTQTHRLPNIEFKKGVTIIMTGATSVGVLYGHGI